MMLNIKITNIDDSQAIAITNLMNEWIKISKENNGKWTSFYVDENFKPNIKIIEKKVKKNH